MIHIISSHESYIAKYKYIRDTCQQDRPKGITLSFNQLSALPGYAGYTNTTSSGKCPLPLVNTNPSSSSKRSRQQPAGGGYVQEIMSHLKDLRNVVVDGQTAPSPGTAPPTTIPHSTVAPVMLPTVPPMMGSPIYML